MAIVRITILICLLLFAAGVLYDVSRRTGAAAVPTDAPDVTIKNPDSKRSPWTGSASCVGRSCHGGIEPRSDGVCLQNEYTTIATRDPHARAYQVLLEERSREMVRRMGRADGDAHRDRRCLACHATPFVSSADSTNAAPAPALIETEASFGVGCESCHGEARLWINRHYRGKLKRIDPGPPLNELIGGIGVPTALDQSEIRPRKCADCHVGSKGDRDVDHDMIAAGHPRLLFEFVSLQDAMPPHWKPRTSDVVHEWFVGQIAGARACLDLLSQRAANAAHPWPEFAEYDCFACHHDLKEKAWRQRLGAKSKPGTLPWNSWTFDVVTRLLDQQGLPTKEWSELRQAMEKFADREIVRDALKRAERRLVELETFAPEWKKPATLLEFLKRPDWATANSWEAAEQYYFALRALKKASDDPDLARRIAELEPWRGFDPSYTSPRRFDPREFFKR